MLGSSFVEATRLIDLRNYQRSQQVLLLLPKSKNKDFDNQPLPDVEHSDATENFTLSGTLLVNTLFIPDMKTRFEFDLYENFSIFRSPEAKIHHHLLMGHQLFDLYHYAVPMKVYDPHSHSEGGTEYAIADANGRPAILEE